MADSRPNILILLTDSSRADTLGCYGSAAAKTPNLDRLAAQGVRFDAAYCACPVCHPARSAMLTGQYPRVNGMIHNSEPDAPGANLCRDMPTFNEIMAGAGYHVGYAGQWGMLSNAGITDVIGGYDRFKHYMRDHYGRGDEPKAPPPDTPFGMPVPLDQVRDHHYANDGLELLEQYAQLDQPWLLHIEFDRPHEPCLPSQEAFDRFDPRDIPLPASLRDDFKDKPARHRDARKRQQCEGLDDDRWREILRLYHAMHATIDDEVGRILDRLDALGLADNTIVIFSSDHGSMAGGHGVWHKYVAMFEELLRVPLIIRWPGVAQAGSAVDSFVCSLDWLPTFAQIAGSESPSGPGRSLVPWLRGEPVADWRQAMVCEHHGLGQVDADIRSYRDQRFKYVFSQHDEDELYDLAQDPDELTNLVEEAQYADALAQCRQNLRAILTEHGDPFASAI